MNIYIYKIVVGCFLLLSFNNSALACACSGGDICCDPGPNLQAGEACSICQSNSAGQGYDACDHSIPNQCPPGGKTAPQIKK